jgi:hypothetical protein
MRRVAALYASLQAVGIGWLASGGALLSSAHSANPADDGGWAQARRQGAIEAVAPVDADVVMVTTMGQ